MCQPFIDPGNVDRNLRTIDRSGIEEGRHQGQLVVFPAEVKLRAILPGVPECSDGEDLLAQLSGNGFRPSQAEAPLDMRLDLGPKPKYEAPAGLGGQVPGSLGQA